MTRRAGWLGFGVALLLAWVAACSFEPDLSRYAACAEGGGCPSGTTCLIEAQRCLPDCGARGPCLPDEPVEPTPDAATDADGGTDAGLEDAGTDAGGEDAGTDAGAELDAGSEDAGPGDAGVDLDAGTDAGTKPLLRFAGPAVLANAYDGQNYTEQVSALGGMPPYRFALADGGLPPGLSLADGGVVTGKPSGTRNADFQVRVTDSDTPPQSVLGSAFLSVVPAPSGLTVATQSLPDARVGQAYRYQLRAGGVVGTLTWKFLAGDPPPGLQFGSDGVISGTPTETKPSRTYTFIMQVDDAALLYSASADRNLTLTIHPAD